MSLIWVTMWANYMFRSGHQMPGHEIIGAHTVDGTTEPHQRRVEGIDKDENNLVLWCSLSSMCLAD